jgi:hypothetical protein
MPVQIGVTARNFTDPTGLLSDCHRRVEMFLGMLTAVAKVIDRPATVETSQALERPCGTSGKRRQSIRLTAVEEPR